MTSRFAVIAAFVLFVAYAASAADQTTSPEQQLGERWPSVSPIQDREYVAGPARPAMIQPDLCQDLCVCPGDTTIEVVANAVCRTYTDETQVCEAAPYRECARRERRKDSNTYFCRTCV
jgi:hypothetical protein